MLGRRRWNQNAIVGPVEEDLCAHGFTFRSFSTQFYCELSIEFEFILKQNSELQYIYIYMAEISSDFEKIK